MQHWLWWAWLQIWPNLAASVIWGTPTFILFLAHHLHVRRSLDSLHAKVDQREDGGPA